MNDATTVLNALEDGVRTITLNRPERLNAINPTLLADLLNSKNISFSKASSSATIPMTISSLSVEAPRKGIDIMGTGDCLNNKWLKEIKSCTIIDEGTLEMNHTRFILSTEIEDASSSRNDAIVAAYATGAYSYQDLAHHFGMHFTTVGRIVRRGRAT